MADGYISQIKTPDNKVYDFRDQHLKVYTGSCTTAAATAIKDVTTDGNFELEKGAVVFVNFSATNTVAVANLKLRVNSSTDTDAKPLKHQYNASESNLPGAGYIRANQTYAFYYDGTNWVMITDYNSNNNDTSTTYERYNHTRLTCTTTFPRYTLALTHATDSTKIIPINSTENNVTDTKTTITSEPFNIFEKIYYKSDAPTTVLAANSLVAVGVLWYAYSALDLRYSFNLTTTSLTAHKDVYLVCSLVTPTTAILRGSSVTGANASTLSNNQGPITQTLPSSEDNLIYIKLGRSYSAYQITLTADHPIYWYKDGALRLYTEGRGINNITRSGTTFTATRDDGSTFTFTQQDSDTKSFTITANATDGLWDLTGTNGTNAVTYSLAPYSAKGSAASFYTAATNPTLTTRLNYDGYLYATKLYSDGNEVLTSHQSLDGYKTRQVESKVLSAAGWYRILDCTTYSMAFFITFYGGYNHHPPTPVTFLVSHAYNTTKIEQIGRSANIGWIKELRAVHHDTSKFYIDVYYAGNSTNNCAFEITPLDPNARSNITLIDFTSITDSITANASCETTIESYVDIAREINITLKNTTSSGQRMYLLGTTATPTATTSGVEAYGSTGLWVNGADKGKFELVLGNATATTTSGGQFGQLALYSASTAGTYLKAADGTTWKTQILQAKDGTIALISDIPTNLNQLTNGPGYVTSSGITSVTIGATSPVQSSTSTAQTGSSASTTISLKDAYGDTKNPYGTKAKNLVLAGPSSGSDAVPNFRALVAADIPELSWNKITSNKPTTLSGYGITDAKIASGVITLGSNTITPITSIADLTGSTITATNLRTNLGLSAALRFIGKATTDISESTTTAPTVTGVTNYVPEIGDVVLDKNSDAEYVCIAKTTTNGTTAYTWELLGRSGSWATSTHTHGNITNGGLLGAASQAVVTDENKKITTADLSVSDPTAATTTSTTFIDTISQNAQGKITATKKTLPTLTNVTQSSNSEDKEFPVILKNTNNTTDETAGVKYADGVTVNPSEKTVTADEFIGNIKTNKIIPTIKKTWASTSYYATAANQVTSTWFFMSIKPDSWYTPWRVRFKIHTYCPGHLNCDSVTYSTYSGRADSLIVHNWNERYDHAHYYTTARLLKNAGFTAGLGHALGISIFYSNGYTNSGYYRTFELEYYDCDGCTVTILDNPVLWTEWANGTDTNYNGYSNSNAVDRGLQETGDATADTADRTLQTPRYLRFKSGAAGIGRYTIIMEESTGAYSSINTTFATTNNPTTITDMTMNTTVKYKLGRIFWHNQNVNRAANTNIAYDAQYWQQYDLIDIRYSFKVTAGELTAYEPFYMVGTLDDDGLFTLNPAATAWTQTLPVSANGNIVYVFLGTVYPDTNTYRIALELHHPIYKSASKQVNPGDITGNAATATTATNVTISADTTTNKEYALVFGTTPSDGTSPTAAKTEGLQKNITKLYTNPSTGTLYSTKFCVDEHVTLQYNTTDSSLEFVFA